jgi:16S rRNA (guanine966-N2)-methyltransferase
VFNWLAGRLPGSRCLDLFAGSGALGFEAASRGASHVTMVEANPRSARRLEENRRTLGLETVEVHCRDAVSFIRQCSERFEIVFVDPPFDADTSRLALDLLRTRPVLADNGIVYLERRAERDEMPETPGFRPVRSGRAGEVDFRLLERADPDLDPTA